MAHHPKPPETYMSSYQEESLSDTIIRQLTHKPIVTLSFVSLSGALGYGYYRWKTKGALVSTSLFLMQLRVGAQAAAIGCVTIGMIYNMINHVMNKNEKPQK